MPFIKFTNLSFEYDPKMHLFILSFDATHPVTKVTSRYVARLQPTEDPMIIAALSNAEDTINNRLRRQDDADNNPWSP